MVNREGKLMLTVENKSSEGTKFRIWCERYGREIPNHKLENLMNADPQAGREVRRLDQI